MHLSASRPNIEDITSLIDQITAIDDKSRADLIKYLDYCNKVVLRTYVIVENCKKAKDFLSTEPDGDIAEEKTSAERKEIEYDETHAHVMREIFEEKVTEVKRLLNQHNTPTE
jgi:hypothetical protein